MSRVLCIITEIILFPILLLIAIVVGLIEVYRSFYNAFIAALHHEDIV